MKKLTRKQAYLKLKKNKVLSTDMLEPLGISFETFLSQGKYSPAKVKKAVEGLIKILDKEFTKTNPTKKKKTKAARGAKPNQPKEPKTQKHFDPHFQPKNRLPKVLATLGEVHSIKFEAITSKKAKPEKASYTSKTMNFTLFGNRETTQKAVQRYLATNGTGKALYLVRAGLTLEAVDHKIEKLKSQIAKAEKLTEQYRDVKTIDIGIVNLQETKMRYLGQMVWIDYYNWRMEAHQHEFNRFDTGNVHIYGPSYIPDPGEDLNTYKAAIYDAPVLIIEGGGLKINRWGITEGKGKS